MGFQRRVENFICEHCKAKVIGNGYTNHCPKCLWSKHVDTTPGDRAHTCGGMMKPIRVEGGTPKYVIIQKCEKCGFEWRNGVAEEDSPDALVALSGKARH